MKKIPDPEKMTRIKGPQLKAKDEVATKVRVTTYLDKDVLDVLKNLARDNGGKYQTLLNQILRRSLLDKKEGLVARIERLEKAVFKGKSAA